MKLTRTRTVALTLTANRGALSLGRGAAGLTLDLTRTLVVAAEGTLAARLEGRVAALENRFDDPPVGTDPVAAYLTARTVAP